MTKSTKEIPSGKQLCDILYDILAKCWEHKEEVRINHRVKSRAAAQAKAAAANKAVDETKYRSSTDTNEMPENWMPPEFGPWLLWGDLADDRHPNFCLNVADAAEGASVGSNTSLVSVLDQPSTVTGKYSRRRQRAQELEEKFKLHTQDAKSDQGAQDMLQVHMKMTKNFMEAHLAKNTDDKKKALNISTVSMEEKRQRLGAAEASSDDEDDSNRNSEHYAEYFA